MGLAIRDADACVTGVTAGGWGERAGLLVGDNIIEVGGADWRASSQSQRLEVFWDGMAYPHRTGFRPVSPCHVTRRICGVHVTVSHVRFAESCRMRTEVSCRICGVSFRTCTGLDRN